MSTELTILISAVTVVVFIWASGMTMFTQVSRDGDGGSDPSGPASQPESNSEDSDAEISLFKQFIANFDEKWWKKQNKSPNDDVFLPREVMECDWTEDDPELSDRVRTFLGKHQDLSPKKLENMVYGEDYVYALHGTPQWNAVTSLQKEAYGVCGEGVYFALSAGVCRNTNICRTKPCYEFTILDGARFSPRRATSKLPKHLKPLDAKTRFVIALVLRPECNPPSSPLFTIREPVYTENWALADETNVLPLKIATVSTEKLIPILMEKYNNFAAKDTQLFQDFSGCFGRKCNKTKVEEYFTTTLTRIRNEEERLSPSKNRR